MHTCAHMALADVDIFLRLTAGVCLCVRNRMRVKLCVFLSLRLYLCVSLSRISFPLIPFLFFFFHLPTHQSILILSVFQEGGRSKSHRYWPKLGSKHNSATHGKFKVTTKFRTDSGCYATTGLKVKHLLSGQERTVWHLQYTDWPEQGCPEYVQGFLGKYYHLYFLLN